MIVQKSNKEIEKAIKCGKIDILANIVPSIGDTILETLDKRFNLIKMIKSDLPEKRDASAKIKKELFILSSISLVFKGLVALRDMPFALTSKYLMDKLKLNIVKDKNDKERPILLENNIRNFIENYESEELIEFFNKEANKFSKIVDPPNIHILDCTDIEVNLKNKNYENSTCVTGKKGIRVRGYKCSVLRGITTNGGIIEEMNMSTINVHDQLASSKMILNSKHLKKDDILLQDRGFIDLKTFRKLVEKGIKIIMPTKKNMLIYKDAVGEAIKEDKWKEHPNKKRKGQKIQLIKKLEDRWLLDKELNKKPENLKELNYSINCVVVRFEISKNKEILKDNKNSENISKIDAKYAYAVFLTNDINLSDNEVIRYYEQRPEIEEDFRQLKDFWNLDCFNSTNYKIIIFHIISVLMAYNYFQVFKELPEGEEYINLSLPVAREKENMKKKAFTETYIFVSNSKYFAIFTEWEFMDIYSSCEPDIKQKLKKVT